MTNQENQTKLGKLIISLLINESNIVKSVNFGKGSPTKAQLSRQKRLLEEINKISEINVDAIINYE